MIPLWVAVAWAFIAFYGGWLFLAFLHTCDLDLRNKVITGRCPGCGEHISLTELQLEHETPEDRVVAALRQKEVLFGLELAEETGLSIRRLYPVLAHLEQQGRVVAERVDQGEGQRTRRGYRLAGGRG